MSAVRRGAAAATGTSRSGKKGAKDKDSEAAAAAELKREKQKHDFEFESDEAKRLRAEIRANRADYANELRTLNECQAAKAKIDQFMELAKARRESLKMDLRNSLRTKADLEEKQGFELKVYKQKVKHLLHEQQANMTLVRMGREEELAAVQDSTRASEHEEALQNREIKIALKHSETSYIDFLTHQKLEQEKAITALRYEFEQKARELKEHYEKKQKILRDQHEESRREEVTRLELKKNTHIADLMAKHKRRFDKIKKYYSDITHANLELIKNLKEEVGDMKKKEAAVQKEVAEIRRINRRLSKPLARNRALVTELQKQLLQYKKDRVLLDACQTALKELEAKTKNVGWEMEILAQKMANLHEEKGVVENRLEKTIYEVQQKMGFKNLLLEKKLTAMSQDLEKTESALAEVLASTNLHASVRDEVSRNLEDVLIAKNKVAQQLEDRLDALKRLYARTIQTYEAKLAEYQIPVEELGFTATRRL